MPGSQVLLCIMTVSLCGEPSQQTRVQKDSQIGIEIIRSLRCSPYFSVASISGELLSDTPVNRPLYLLLSLARQLYEPLGSSAPRTTLCKPLVEE